MDCAGISAGGCVAACGRAPGRSALKFTTVQDRPLLLPMNAPASLCLCLSLCLADLLQASGSAPSAPQTDVIVVGAGIAGLSAALESAQRGASAMVIDMASVFGGHAVMSFGMVCMVGTPEQEKSGVADSAELAAEDFLRFGEDADPGWARLFAKDSRREVYDWLRALGMSDWELYPRIIPGNSVRRQHVARGRGVGLVSPIYLECLRYPNLQFVWNTKVTGLICEGGRITGVRGVHQRTGDKAEFRASAVVLATGGFESNLELVRASWPAYFPPLADDTRVLLGSGIHSLGSGLELAQGADAGMARLDHQLFYSTGLVDPRDPTGRRGLHAFNSAAIWVNAQGERFVLDGAPDPKLQMPAVLRQSPATYWAIFDAGSKPRFFVSGSDFNDPAVVQREIFENPKLTNRVKRAETIEALARAAGLPPARLAQTVARWHELISQGADADFDRFGKPGQEQPVKIETPPFYAVQFFPLARKSLGGVAVDLSCRVLDRRGQPIPGLYAAGELTGVGGINGQAALEGTMLGPSIYMGRVAARTIAESLERPLHPATPAIPAPAPEAGPATDPENLRAWREVLGQLAARPRPGYYHFEKAHTVVLDRNYDCARCHRESSPLSLTEALLDRRALVQSCAICHGGVKE